MRSKNYTLLSLLCSIIFMFVTTNLVAQNYFPLEVGNRWDYFVERHIPGGHISYDTLTILITEKQILPNNLEYYLFSGPFTWWYYPYPKYIREENNKIYFFDEEDSVDCFAFRFDIPLWSFYYDCKGGELHIYDIDTSYTLGYPDIRQNQNFRYDFSDKFGIYHLFEYGIINSDYTLKGCIISDTTYGQLLVSVDETEPAFPTKFSLSQNYPNPFNPRTIIKYALSERQFVSLKVYDVLGNEVATLVNEEKPAGSYEVEFNGTGLPSGIYFYRLQTGSFVETKKMVLLK